MNKRRSELGGLLMLTRRTRQRHSTGNIMNTRRSLHCKKSLSFFPSPAGVSLTKGYQLVGIIKLFPDRFGYSDITAGDGKTVTFFYGVLDTAWEGNLHELKIQYLTDF
jgi:hypothetical protein